jgi:hypothetical protein
MISAGSEVAPEPSRLDIGRTVIDRSRVAMAEGQKRDSKG